jgi:tRNA (cytidine56-2'-O)-methyltransferase
MPITVLRLGHRRIRDQRVTTHVCLVARAFGAEGIFVSGEQDSGLLESVRKIAKKWGGEFWILHCESPVKIIREWKAQGGKVAHLTMYGEPLLGHVDALQKEQKLLVIVGAEKVPPEIYKLSDYNLAVTFEPHSEVAALAISLDRCFGGAELQGGQPEKLACALKAKIGKR